MKKQIVLGVMCAAMGFTSPMACVYGSTVIGTGFRTADAPGAAAGGSADGAAPESAPAAGSETASAGTGSGLAAGTVQNGSVPGTTGTAVSPDAPQSGSAAPLGGNSQAVAGSGTGSGASGPGAPANIGPGFGVAMEVGPGSGQSSGQSGKSAERTLLSDDEIRALDQATYAASGGKAPGSISISAAVPEGYVDVTTAEVSNPIVQNPLMYTYDYMVHDIQALSERYGGKMKVNVPGTSPDGRNIYELVLGNPDAETQILINGSIHAREYIVSNVIMKQIEYLLAFQDSGSFDGKPMSTWMNEVGIHYVPMINPDGVTISQYGVDGLQNQHYKDIVLDAYARDRIQGRTRAGLSAYTRRWKANANGVNLNQNFDWSWEKSSGKANGPSSDSYRGSAPNSEPETQVMSNLIRGSHWEAILNYHAMGNIMYWNTPDNRLLQHSTDLSGILQKLTGYRKVMSDGGGGGMMEFALWVPDPAVSITLELGSTEAPVSTTELPVLWKQHKYVPLYTMKWALERGIH